MRIGPSSLHATSVIARGYRRPKLRGDLRISRQEIAGKVSYVIKIPETESYARYGELEFDLLTLADGTRMPAEIAVALGEIHPDSAVDESDVLEYLDDSDPNLWERTPAERNLALLAKIRDERKGYVGQSSLLYMPVTSWDPDQLLDRLHPYVRWMYTRGFVIFSLLLFVWAAYIIGGDFVRIQKDTVAFYTFSNQSAYDLAMFWLVMLLVGGIHEFGHGMTCKHFGGEVHHMGFLLIYFTPAFYTDTSDQYLFPGVAPREWVIFAGIWVELVVCSLATLAWHFLPPATLWSDFAYKLILLSAFSSFLNLNPLMKFDGYYALAQYLRMDNLREDAFAYTRAWLQRVALRQDVELPAASRRQRRIYKAYAPAAFVYSTSVLVVVVFFVKNVLVRHFGGWGYVFTLGMIYFVLRNKFQQIQPALGLALARGKEHAMAWKLSRTGKAGVAAAVVVFALVPLPTTVTSRFVLQPMHIDEIRPPAGGVVRQVFVKTNQRVATRQLIATMANPSLEAAAVSDQSRLAGIERVLLVAESRGDTFQIGRGEQRYRQMAAQLAEVRTKLAGLELRSTIPGIVTTPEVSQKTGIYLHQGQTLADVVDTTKLKARLLVIDRDLQFVRPGALVELKVSAYPFHAFAGHVVRVMPAASTDGPVGEKTKPEGYGQELLNYFAAVVVVPNPHGMLREGMSGEAKIYAPARSAAWQAGRKFGRWVLSQVWW